MDTSDMYHLIPTVYPTTMKMEEDKDHTMTVEQRKEKEPIIY